jgi:hypothetical protein
VLDKHDRYTVASIAAGFVVWWIFFGKAKYWTKGMHR